MKRFLSDLEPSMESTVESKIELQVKKRKFDHHGTPLPKMESLPASMFHLGGENFVSIAFFLGHTRVHIRRYITDNDGFLHPTKDGVSLHPSVWNSFQEKVKVFDFSENCLIVDKDLCVSFEKTNDVECFYVFQRMFKRKNFKLEFLPESVTLSMNQLSNLVDSLLDINAKVKELLIKETLYHFVLHESKSKRANASDNVNFFDSEMSNFVELTDSLSECLTNAISIKISELLNCFACQNNLPKPYHHNCDENTREEQYFNYFDIIFYTLDWHEIAKDFYCKNSNRFSMGVSEFFLCLDVSILFKNVKNLYVKNEKQ